jgi:Ran GTPase-activating protein (RanGAP) involved in mRNA processing and transport
VEALAASPHLARLTYLSLKENSISEEGAAALAASPHLANLTFLNLNNNYIGAEGAAALRERYGSACCF